VVLVEVLPAKMKLGRLAPPIKVSLVDLLFLMQMALAVAAAQAAQVRQVA
jgi:hypothetical protein